MMFPDSGLVNAVEQEAVPLPFAGTLGVTTAGPHTVGPPAEPWWKVTLPVGTTPDAEAPLGAIVAVKVTV